MWQCRHSAGMELNQRGVGEQSDVSAKARGHVWFTEDITISTITVREHEISISEIYQRRRCRGICRDLQHPCPNADIYHRHNAVCCWEESDSMLNITAWCHVHSDKKSHQQGDSPDYESCLTNLIETLFFLDTFIFLCANARFPLLQSADG